MTDAAATMSLDFDPVELRKKYRAERDRRIKAEGNDQYIKIEAEFSHYLDDPYVEPGFERALRATAPSRSWPARRALRGPYAQRPGGSRYRSTRR